MLQQHVNSILPSLNLKKMHISHRSAWQWLWRLGYHCKKHTKGVYWDGHEWKDVWKQHKAFLAKVEELDRCVINSDSKRDVFNTTYLDRLAPVYDGNEMVETLPQLACDKKLHIWITHNETASYANEYTDSYYLKHGQQVLKKKERRQLMMTSGYLCQRYSNLALTEEMLAKNDTLPPSEHLVITNSCVTIYPSSKARGDDYWNMDQMIAQVSLQIP